MEICHIPIKIIQRSKGKSAVVAAAYRSGTKLTNEWDGMTHDYTRKGGVICSEILLPIHAPPEFSDRSTLWNSVEQIEKARDSQLARELTRKQQLALVRSYVQDTFVSAGMCADFALHDKGDGNPHAHILLTIRPLKEDGTWGAKCRKVYETDECRQRIPDGKGGWKSHWEDTTNWNDKGNAEVWRAAWAAHTNQALEDAGRPERIDHRSYKRQGIDKIPTIHMGVAATRMERRGIFTDKGNVNRQIAADNKLLKERMTRLYNWSKIEAEKPQNKESTLAQLWQARQEMSRPTSRAGKVKALKESAALFNFLQTNGITSMQQLHEKISAMNSQYYNLRGEIVSIERQIASIQKQIEMWTQYSKYRPIRKQLDRINPEKQELFKDRHSRELILYAAADRFLQERKDGGEVITPKVWKDELIKLTTEKDKKYTEMRAMREELKSVEQLKKAAEGLAKEEQSKLQNRESER